MKMSMVKMAAIIGSAGIIGYAIVMSNPKIADMIKNKAKLLTDEVSDKVKEELK